MQVTIARLYETHADAVRVVDALLIAGVPAQDISMLSNNADNWVDSGASAAKPADAKPDAKTDAKPDAKSAATKPADAMPSLATPAHAKPAAKRAEVTPGTAVPRSPQFEGGVVGAAIGAAAATAGTVVGTLALLTIPGVGPVAGAGWLLGLLVAGAAVGGATGGILGALASAGVSEADASVYAEGLRRGGSLVTARVPPADVPRVQTVMEEGAVNIAERRGDFRRSGWQTFDPAAPPYSAEQIRSERLLHRAA